MKKPASADRSALALIWATAAIGVAWWPGRITGPLDGAPLDGLLETILLGAIAPIAWWLQPQFFRSRLAQAAIVAVALLKLAGGSFTQEGLCVRFDPPKPVVRGTTARPHSWDLRADWRSPNPTCSAVMTTAYGEFKRFPVWFFNLPPTDDNWPEPTDRPPGATLGMTVVGFIDAKTTGLLEIVTGPGMDMTVVVDGQPSDHADLLSHKIQLAPGIHFVEASGTLTGNQWRFLPSWNRALLGTAGFPTVTLARPAAIDRGMLPSALRWLTTLLMALLVTAWAISAFSASASSAMLTWAAAASVGLALLAPQASNQFATTELARWSITALALGAMVPVAEKFRTLRGLFILIGVPWLVFIGITSIDHVGKFSLYAGGDDMWSFQRLSYRTYLEGYFLEGGQPLFKHQPLYRWIAGGLHVIFGDSSIGEFFWDGVCLLSMALFAGEATRRLAGFRAGLITAAMTLTLIMRGPTWGFFGSGLSETSAAGLVCMAALTALGAGQWPAIAMAGVLATLGFYTRLNNLGIALTVAVFAIPLSARAGDWIRPSRWFASTRPGVAVGVVAALGIGLLLFALRTWHYTGVFSVLHGTLFNSLSVWRPGMSIVDWAQSATSSVMMVLTMNDPPRLSAYSIPMLAAAVISIGGLVGIKGLRRTSLPLGLFFLSGCAGALVARGSAYSGRFSTILIGATGAVLGSAIAAALQEWRTSRQRESVVTPEE